MGQHSDTDGLASSKGRALGTDVRVVVTRPHLLAAARSAVDRVLDDIDVACSRFREDSELSRLNAAAGHRRNPLHSNPGSADSDEGVGSAPASFRAPAYAGRA